MKIPEFNKPELKNIENIKNELSKLKTELEKLKIENENLKKELQKIKSTKPESSKIGKVKLSNLVDVFGSIVSEVKGSYAVSKIDVELSTQIESDGTVRIIPPDSDVKLPQAIDKIKLSIKPILFSEKRELIEVPKVVGLELSEAKNVIKRANLNVGKIIYSKSLSKKGTVISQFPESECLVERDVKVDLTVSSGSSRQV